MNELEKFQIEKELINFSHSVFNYYNGKINKYMDCTFVIDPNSSEMVLGYIAVNRINLNLYLIVKINNWDMNGCKADIIETIIHELFHSNQVINQNEYSENKEYREQIENEVKYATSLYIVNNLQLISTTFNVQFNVQKHYFTLDIELSRNQYRMQEICQPNYEEYYCNLLTLIKNESSQFIIQNIKTIGTLIIKFNNIDYVLKSNYQYNGNINEILPLYNELFSMNSNCIMFDDIKDSKTECYYDRNASTVIIDCNNINYRICPIERGYGSFQFPF